MKMNRLSPVLERLIVGITLCAGFVLMASIFVPDRTQAELDPSQEVAAPPLSTNPHEGLQSLGTIEDDRYSIDIYVGDEGPLYSIYDAADGRELAVLLTAKQVAEWFPDLPIPDMDFGGEGPVMLAEPDFGPPTD